MGRKFQIDQKMLMIQRPQNFTIFGKKTQVLQKLTRSFLRIINTSDGPRMYMLTAGASRICILLRKMLCYLKLPRLINGNRYFCENSNNEKRFL